MLKSFKLICLLYVISSQSILGQDAKFPIVEGFGGFTKFLKPQNYQTQIQKLKLL